MEVKPASASIFRAVCSPHTVPAHSAVGKRNGHALHARYGVQERPERVVQVLRELAGGRGVHAQVDTAGAQGLGGLAGVCGRARGEQSAASFTIASDERTNRADSRSQRGMSAAASGGRAV